MTSSPEPQGAKQEPDFAAMFTPAFVAHDGSTAWTVTTEQRDAILSALAAGQACPAKPGGELHPCMCRFDLVPDHDDPVEECEYHKQMRDDIAMLKAALRKYGQHSGKCDSLIRRNQDVRWPCSCGFEAALINRSDAGGGDEA